VQSWDSETLRKFQCGQISGSASVTSFTGCLLWYVLFPSSYIRCLVLWECETEESSLWDLFHFRSSRAFNANSQLVFTLHTTTQMHLSLCYFI